MQTRANGQHQISSDELYRFRRDGVVALRSVVGQKWQDTLSGAIERDIANPGPFFHGYQSEDSGLFHGNLRTWQNDQDFAAFCLQSNLPGIAKQLLATERLNLLYDQLFVKGPNTNNPTRWHNDQPYWPIRGQQVLSIWVALDKTTLDSGALEFIRGSHTWDRWFQPKAFGITDAADDYEINPSYEDIPDIESKRDSYDIVSWDLEPGDVYVFHALTVHGALGNRRADRRRRGYAVRYTGDDIVYDQRPGTSKPLWCEELTNGAALDSDQYPTIPQS